MYNANMNDDATKKTLELILTHALKLLARRPQSEFELKFKLSRFGNRNKVSDIQLVLDETVSYLKKQDLINDISFAEWFSKQRQDFKPTSRRRLSFELSQKGVSRKIIEDTLNSYDEELACRTLAHQKRHMKREKLIQYLLRLGFGWDVVEDALS